jgi:hypothetical protein
VHQKNCCPAPYPPKPAGCHGAPYPVQCRTVTTAAPRCSRRPAGASLLPTSRRCRPCSAGLALGPMYGDGCCRSLCLFLLLRGTLDAGLAAARPGGLGRRRVECAHHAPASTACQSVAHHCLAFLRAASDDGRHVATRAVLQLAAVASGCLRLRATEQEAPRPLFHGVVVRARARGARASNHAEQEGCLGCLTGTVVARRENWPDRPSSRVLGGVLLLCSEDLLLARRV